MTKPKFIHGAIPDGLITMTALALELGISMEKLEFLKGHYTPPYYRFHYGREMARPSFIPEWQEVVRHFDSLPPPQVPNTASSHGFVYYVQAKDLGGPIKVGTAGLLERRLATLQAANPFPLRLLACEPGGQKREMERHIEFHYWRLHGEWFREDCPELKRVLAEVRREWGTPYKNRLPKKIREIVSPPCNPEEVTGRASA